MWKIALFVLAFSYLILLVLLRSVLLPLKAVLMNLLSVGAAYGVLVAVFQWGWLDGFAGFQSLGYINTMTPPLLLAIVFGLSMDYEVFLLSRIRERYDATGDTRKSVAQGLAASAATISSAALIMVAVFAVFAGTGVPSIKEIGLGLAVAIALDATIVRLVLVPATMEIMGHWNWWLPRPLDRVLPHTDFEAPQPRHLTPCGHGRPALLAARHRRRAVRGRTARHPRVHRHPGRRPARAAGAGRQARDAAAPARRGSVGGAVRDGRGPGVHRQGPGGA